MDSILSIAASLGDWPLVKRGINKKRKKHFFIAFKNDGWPISMRKMKVLVCFVMTVSVKVDLQVKYTYFTCKSIIYKNNIKHTIAFGPGYSVMKIGPTIYSMKSSIELVPTAQYVLMNTI